MTAVGRSARGSKRTGAIGRERRLPVDNRALLTWRTGDKYRIVSARFEDMSLLGAWLAADGEPPAGESVWVRLVEPCESNWVEARVAGIAESGEIGVSFPGSCPYALYRAMVPAGKEAEPQEQRINSPESDQLYWRWRP